MFHLDAVPLMSASKVLLPPASRLCDRVGYYMCMFVCMCGCMGMLAERLKDGDLFPRNFLLG